MFLALGHLTVTDELLMRSTSDKSDDARRGVAEENNIPHIYVIIPIRLDEIITSIFTSTLLSWAWRYCRDTLK